MQSELRLVLGALAAVAVPAAALHFTTGEERLTAGLTAAPFGWSRILVAHLVTALPLGFILAGWVRSVPDLRESPRGWWVVGALAAIGLVLLVGPGSAEAVITGDLGPVAAIVLRSGLAVVLVLPWCVAALDPPPQGTRPVRPGAMLCLGACLAIVPCGLYANAVIATKTEQTTELLNRERLVLAEGQIEGLCELGSDRPVLNRSPGEVRVALAAAIPKLKQVAARPLSPTTSPATRLDRAILFVRLDRLDDAARLLESLVPTDTVQLLLASVYRDQSRWSESDALYSEVLQKSITRAADSNAKSACLTAIEGLAFNARAERRPADAERVLQLGLAALPTEAAHFHFQLGRHYADGGRTGQATEHLRAATTLDPTRFREPVDKLMGQLWVATPACFGPTGSLTEGKK
ncbi:MAG: hypothetical protein C0467_25590 [Planctomycetaceae bacterium]|nr:hypothetical protein [Planctomycetaceae bacterium]